MRYVSVAGVVRNRRRARGWVALSLLLACGEDSKVAIGPAGGLVSSDDETLTIVIWPGAIGSYMDFEITPSTMPPDSFGRAYLVRPNVELDVDAEIIYRGELPTNLASARIGAITQDEYSQGNADWKPIPAEPGAVDDKEGTVRAHDDELALYYTLLGDGVDTVADTGDPSTDPSGDPTGDTSDSAAESDPTGPPVSYTNDIQPIWDASCANMATCHLQPGPAQGLDLSGNSYDAIVDVPSVQTGQPLIDPDNPDGSYILLKIEGDSSILGGPMPSIGTPLTADQVDTIRNWIAQGAPA